MRRVMQVTVAGRAVRLAGGTTSTKRWFALPLTPVEALAAADGGLVLEVGADAKVWPRTSGCPGRKPRAQNHADSRSTL